MSPPPLLVGGHALLVRARRARRVEALRILLAHDGGQDLLEDALVPALDGGLRVLAEVELPLPAPTLPGRLVLVVARPEREARVVAQAPHVVDGLAAHVLEEGVVARIHAAGEHEVLPDEDAELVREVVEAIVLVDAAAPDAQHVHVRVGRLTA
jgi:hypothetical protein